MPLHDWTRVDAGMFHHFHNAWIYRLADSLNSGGLPPEFFAAGEQYTGDDIPDVLTLSREATGSPSEWSGHGALAVVDHPPTALFQEESDEARYLRKQDRLAIREVHGSRLVAVIEIVSRGNKSSRRRLDRFLEKACRLIDDGIHFTFIDCFPPSQLDSGGLHAALWEAATGELAVACRPQDRTVAAYCSGPRLKAYVHALEVTDPWPASPLFLDGEHYVSLPLEETYMQVWANYPAPWKPRLDSH